MPEADAFVDPQLVGAAYHEVAALKTVPAAILLLTSEFGTVSMWDWEWRRFLAREGIRTIAPTSLEQAKVACRALGVKRDLRRSTFVVFQDDPGNGAQPGIFKRFFWWEDECSKRMFDKFGVRIVVRSWKRLSADAKEVADSAAEEIWERWRTRVPLGPVSDRSLRSALKLYSVLKRELDADPTIRGLGINCLNESHFSDTTPCLAWNLLYEGDRLIWGCEADTVSMMTKYLLNKALGLPVMMSNLYPFLMGRPRWRTKASRRSLPSRIQPTTSWPLTAGTSASSPPPSRSHGRSSPACSRSSIPIPPPSTPVFRSVRSP